MHPQTEADGSARVMDINGTKKSLKVLLYTRAVFSRIPIETWSKMGFNEKDPIQSRKRSSAGKKGALRVPGRPPNLVLNKG